MADHCVPVGNGNGGGSVLGVHVYVCILAHCAFHVHPKERA